MSASYEPAGCPACRDLQRRLAALQAEVKHLRAALRGKVASRQGGHAFRPVRHDAAHVLAGPHARRHAKPVQPPAEEQEKVSANVQPAAAGSNTAPPGPATSPPPGLEAYQGAIEGVAFTPLTRWQDARGWLMELFRQDELAPVYHPQMGYVSETRPGVVRGPHEHVEQTDLFVFAGPGTFRLYLWDARLGSATHGRYVAVELGESYPCAVLVPPGVVHAYKNIGSTPGWVFNLPNRLYRGKGRQQAVDEIRHEDRPESPYRVA
jgi:dTDP-4-dehydrorhamnose 3,5-epimerase